MDELLDELRRAFELLDPPPPALFEAARAAFAFRDPDASLAELTRDSTPAGAGLRGTSRLLTFTGENVTVELQVSSAGPVRVLTGRLTPARPATLCVRHSRGETRAQVDESGHFVTGGIPSGQVMLHFTLPDATTVVTSWSRL
ncbi:hypothetical protein [Actinocorallia populi]|uniref:hypothetical protein n=1 Tax=Actinocorallia populi TaxID=2079200 RepID=UPI000D088588|nr:hypothetical protein [Actinocorallia populi]